MTDLDRRFDRVERGLLNPERDPVAGLADRIRVSREAQRSKPPVPMTDTEIMARSRAVREALKQAGRY